MCYTSPSLTKLFCLVLLCLSGSLNSFGRTQHIFHLTNGLSSAEVPFTLVDNLIIVEAVIAGKKSMNFLLDNGTSNPVIFKRAYIKDLPLELGRQISFRGVGSGKAVQATIINGTSLHLSGAASDRIGMVVLDKSPFPRHMFGGLEVHGVLGATLFRSFVVEIDYPGRVLRLHQHRDFLPPQDFHKMPMRVIEQKPYLTATIQGANGTLDAHFMLDLGFNNSLMLQITDSLAKTMLTQRIVTKIGIGYSGAVAGRSGQVASVQIGNKRFLEVPAVVPFQRNYTMTPVSQDITRMGSIGSTLFLDTSIILNYPDETFYFKGTVPYVANREEGTQLPVPAIEENDNMIF